MGGLLLLVIPVLLLFFAVSNEENAQLNGTLVILSATGGMALVALGALLRA